MQQISKEQYFQMLGTDERNQIAYQIWEILNKFDCRIVQMKTTTEEKLAKELGAKLYILKQTAGKAEAINPYGIVYSEQDVINLLRSLGFPTPNFG